MSARFALSLLFSLIAPIRGYYWLRFGLHPMRTQKTREWYDWAAEVGAYSVAVIGCVYILLGERMPLRVADADGLRAGGLLLVGAGTRLFWLSHAPLAQQWAWNIGLRDDHQIVRRGLYRFVRRILSLSKDAVNS